MNISGIWEGTLDGTNWGKLLVKLTERNNTITGVAEITDIGLGTLGTYNLEVTGTRVGDMVGLRLAPTQHGVWAYPGTINVRITKESEVLVLGEWKSTIGTYGTCRAERQDSAPALPEQIAKKIAESNAAFYNHGFW